MRFKLSGLVLVAAVCVATVAVQAAPSSAAAQMTEPRQIEASPKGLIGLGLIGAELGLAIPALAGLTETWSMVVFPLVGGAAGAVAGHFLLDANGHTNPAVGMLVVGMALIVPSIVATLWATRYRPPDAPEASPTDDGPIDDGYDDVAAREDVGGGLVRIGRRGFGVGLPNFGIMQTFTPQELALFGGQQRTEVHLSLLSGSF